MKVLSQWIGGELVIVLAGELDHNAAKSTMRQIDDAIDEQLPKRCVLDMCAVDFMDSSGIAVILRAQKHLDGIGGRLRVENCTGQALRVLDAAGVGKLVTVCAKTEGSRT